MMKLNDMQKKFNSQRSISVKKFRDSKYSEPGQLALSIIRAGEKKDENTPLYKNTANLV